MFTCHTCVTGVFISVVLADDLYLQDITYESYFENV